MKPYYRIELHAHTKESSPCAAVAAPELADRYLSKGYDGIVITDHLSPMYMDQMDIAEDWQAIVDYLLAGYKAVKAASRYRLQVYLGMEIRFPDSSNDYLVYGFDEAFLREHSFLHHMTIKTFSALCREHGVKIFQAHPFRYGMMLANPNWLDGMEVYNGAQKHRSHNEFAALWCQHAGLSPISGSDFHQAGDEGRGGILLPYLPVNDIALAKALQSEDKILLQSMKNLN